MYLEVVLDSYTFEGVVLDSCKYRMAFGVGCIVLHRQNYGYCVGNLEKNIQNMFKVFKILLIRSNLPHMGLHNIIIIDIAAFVFIIRRNTEIIGKNVSDSKNITFL